MQHEIYLFGLNHKTADVEVREAFALGDCENFEQCLLDGGTIRECLVLSTCNRVEILAAAQTGRDAMAPVLERWSDYANKASDTLKPHLYVHKNLDAVRHLFLVASGLDSLVLGEPQILGQIKQAYRRSVDSGSAKVVINRLLHKAFSTAKLVRSSTGIGASAVSISYAAVELAKRIFGEMAGKKAMLVGAGEMAELAAVHLMNAGVEEIMVANRTFSRAEELARRFKGRPILFEELIAKLPEADIVISSTGAPQTVIQARDVKNVLKRRKHRPMFFIDIAVPRDIDPDVNSLDNVFLYDIDDLKEVVEENLAQRQEEAQRAAKIVDAQVERFGHWLNSLDLQPTIVDLLDQGADVAERELQRTLRRLGPDVSDETRAALEMMAKSISRKVLHEPIVFLKRRSMENDGERFIDLTRRMFNLDKDNAPPDAHADRKSESSSEPENEC